MQMANSMIAAASRRAEQVDEEVKRARKMTTRSMMVVGVLLVVGIAAAGGVHALVTSGALKWPIACTSIARDHVGRYTVLTNSKR